MKLLPAKWLSRWLAQPQVTNRDALILAVIAWVVIAGLLYGGRALLRLVDVVDANSAIPLWLAAGVAGLMLAIGLLVGARKGAKTEQLRYRIADLEARIEELATYQTYAEHVRDALADLRKTLAGELPAFSLRDFVENGLFEPAQRLLVRSATRGEVRFSILHADGEDFVMARAGVLYPALGHSLEGRQNFRMPINESFSLYAFQRGRVFASGKLSEDDRFSPHQRATRPYESIVSVPLWNDAEVDGVFNVVATESEAFNGVDRSYLALLGSVIDVARAAAALVSDNEQLAEPDGELDDDPDVLPPGAAAH
jgi:hypothetical protein